MLSVAIISLIMFVLFFILGLLYIHNHLVIKRNQSAVEKYPIYMSTFETIGQRCFDIIYKDELLVYSVEGQKVRDDEFDVIIRKFVDLFFRYCGQTMLKEFVFLYGDVETLTFVLVEFFHTKYENDEIYGDTINNIPNKQYQE